MGAISGWGWKGLGLRRRLGLGLGGADCTHGVGFGNWLLFSVFEKAVGLLHQGSTVKALRVF